MRRAPVPLGNRPYQGQAQAHAAVTFRRTRQAEEGFEDAFAQRHRHTGALVADPQLHLSVADTQGQGHGTRAMAAGALRHAPVQVAVAVTGVAGPTGGAPDKPVGLVWFAFALPGRVLSESMRFPGDRAAVRAATVHHALQRLTELTS